MEGEDFILSKEFFERSADEVARDLLGKVIVRKTGKEILRARIVETEAYFSEEDPASWARFGKRKDNFVMWFLGGSVLIKNVHKYKMLNFVTGSEGKAEAVLIRAVEPLNFSGRGNGPGLLTSSLEIDKNLNGKSIFDLEEFFIEESSLDFEIGKSFRVGVKNDLDKPFRFFIKDNKYVSKLRQNG